MIALVKSETTTPSRQDLDVIKLDTGVTLVHKQIPSSEVVVADVWMNVGVVCEPESWSGISHFLEHMIFKGTKRILPGDFDYLVESSGGCTNAATSYDYTRFFLATATDYFAKTLPYLAEILLAAEIAEEEFYLEREVVLEEIRCSHDDIEWLIFQTVNSTLYQFHPYGRSVLGEEANLLQTTPNQMRCYHKTYYQPENVNVVIVGNISREESIFLVENCFRDFSVPSECPPVIIDSEPPLVDIRRQRLYLPFLENSRLVMAWMGPGVEDLEGAIGLDILSIILAGGRTSRLVRRLRDEKGLVFDVSAQFSLQKHSSLFTITAHLKENSGERIEEIIREEIYRLHNQPVTIAELKNAQRNLCHDYIFCTETPEQLAGLYGYYQILEDARLALKYPHIVRSFVPEKLQRVAQQYLSPEYYVVCEFYPCN